MAHEDIDRIVDTYPGEKCEYRECKSEPVYMLEWFGYNQFMEDPIIVSELYSCNNLQHMLWLCRNESEYEETPEGVSKIIDASKSKFEDAPGMLEMILDELDPSRKQQLLFPELTRN